MLNQATNPNAEATLEQDTINLLAELGKTEWANCQQETATNCAITGRESRTEVVLVSRPRAALARP